MQAEVLCIFPKPGYHHRHIVPYVPSGLPQYNLQQNLRQFFGALLLQISQYFAEFFLVITVFQGIYDPVGEQKYIVPVHQPALYAPGLHPAQHPQGQAAGRNPPPRP